MTPRTLLSWAFSIASIIMMLVLTAAVTQDIYRAEFPRLERLLGIKNARLEVALLVLINASISTFVVFLFGGTRGKLQFKVGPVELKGPSGPILLWICAFVVITGLTNLIINTQMRSY